MYACCGRVTANSAGKLVSGCDTVCAFACNACMHQHPCAPTVSGVISFVDSQATRMHILLLKLFLSCTSPGSEAERESASEKQQRAPKRLKMEEQALPEVGIL